MKSNIKNLIKTKRSIESSISELIEEKLLGKNQVLNVIFPINNIPDINSEEDVIEESQPEKSESNKQTKDYSHVLKDLLETTIKNLYENFYTDNQNNYINTKIKPENQYNTTSNTSIKTNSYVDFITEKMFKSFNYPVIGNNLFTTEKTSSTFEKPVQSEKQLNRSHRDKTNYNIIFNNPLVGLNLIEKEKTELINSDKDLSSIKEINSHINNRTSESSKDSVVTNNTSSKDLIVDRELKDSIVNNNELKDSVVTNNTSSKDLIFDRDSVVTNNTSSKDLIVDRELKDSVVTNNTSSKDLIFDRDSVVTNNTSSKDLIFDRDSVVTNNTSSKDLIFDRDSVVTNNTSSKDLIFDRELKDSVVTNNTSSKDLIFDRELKDSVVTNNTSSKDLIFDRDSVVTNNTSSKDLIVDRDSVVTNNTSSKDLIFDRELKDSVVTNNELKDSVVTNNTSSKDLIVDRDSVDYTRDSLVKDTVERKESNEKYKELLIHNNKNQNLIHNNNSVFKDSLLESKLKENNAEKIKIKKPNIKFPELLDMQTSSFSENFDTRNIISSNFIENNSLRKTPELFSEIVNKQNNIIPALKDGAIVKKPTIAMVGESGPEMIVPVNNSNIEKILQNSKERESISTSTNRSLFENAFHTSQIKAKQMEEPKAETKQTIDLPQLNYNTGTKSAPAQQSAGADAGYSRFDDYLKSRMFSLPEWRTRMG